MTFERVASRKGFDGGKPAQSKAMPQSGKGALRVHEHLAASAIKGKTTRMSEVHITATISGDLIGEVRSAMNRSLDLALTGKVGRVGENSYTHHAFAAYILAVASIEAFLHETLLGWQCEYRTKSSALWQLPEGSIDRMDLLLKLVLVPNLLFGTTFERDKQPFQDFALLCRVRNDVAHFKMHLKKTPNYMRALSERGIALVRQVDEQGAWPHKLSSTEGIRWANNTACSVARQLVAFIPAEYRDGLSRCVSNFSDITSEEVSQRLAGTHAGKF